MIIPKNKFVSLVNTFQQGSAFRMFCFVGKYQEIKVDKRKINQKSDKKAIEIMIQRYASDNHFQLFSWLSLCGWWLQGKDEKTNPHYRWLISIAMIN